MKKFLWISMSLLGVFFFCVSVQAATEFSVTPLNPETGASQGDYFDLLVSPGEEKTLSVRVNNPNEEAITVRTSFNTSTTNDAGATVYTEKNKDSSLKTDISSFSALSNDEVTIPAKSAKEVSLTIKVPEAPFEGELIGGFYFQADEAENQETGLKSRYAYAIAVRLRQSDDLPTPSIKLNRVYIDQASLQNYIRLNLQNQAAVLIKELNIKAEIYQKGGKKPLYTSNNNKLRMAPNSNFNYGVNLDTHLFKPGDYHCKVTGTANGQAFHLETDFVIEKEAARQLNETTFRENEDSNVLWLALVGIVSGLLLLWLFLFVFKWKKVRKHE